MLPHAQFDLLQPQYQQEQVQFEFELNEKNARTIRFCFKILNCVLVEKNDASSKLLPFKGINPILEVLILGEEIICFTNLKAN